MGLFEAEYKRGGFLEFPEGWIHPKRTVDYNEIIYVVKGMVMMFEGDRRFELHKGDCILLEKGKNHGGYEKSDRSVAFYWFEFYSDTDGFEAMKHTSFGSGDSLPDLSRQLVRVSESPTYPRQVNDCYIRLLLNEIDLAAKRVKNTAYPVCGTIAQWIRENNDRKIDVDEISSVFGYNKDYISRAFKRSFGLSLKAYIDSERLRHIKGLLHTTSYPLRQISQMSGFSNYKSFLKFFTYHSKQTPYEFRKNSFMNFSE